MYLVRTRKKNTLVALLEKAGITVYRTELSNMIITVDEPSKSFWQNDYISSATYITSEVAQNFIDPPQSEIKSGDPVWFKSEKGEEYLCLVDEVNGPYITVILKPHGFPRAIRVRIHEVTPYNPL